MTQDSTHNSLLEIKVPYINGNSVESKVSKICKKQGELVFRGDIIAEAESDSYTFDIKSTATGVIREVRKNVGEAVKTDEIFAVISVGDESEIHMQKPKEVDHANKFQMMSNVIDVIGRLFVKKKHDEDNKDNASFDNINEQEEINRLLNDSRDAEESEYMDDEERKESLETTSDESLQLSRVREEIGDASDEEVSNSEGDLTDEGNVALDEDKLVADSDTAQESKQNNKGKKGQAKSKSNSTKPSYDIDLNETGPGSSGVDDEGETYDDSESETKEERDSLKMEKVCQVIHQETLNSKYNEVLGNDKKSFQQQKINKMSGRILSDREKILKNIIMKANNKLRNDKKVEPVFSSITDKVDISSLYEMSEKNSAMIGYKSINMDPFLIKAIGYALEKTSIFNKHVINIICEESLYNRKTIVSNIQLKQIPEIANALMTDKSHVDDNALTVVLNNSSIMSDPISDGTFVFNRCFCDGDRKYAYITMCCAHKQASVFLKCVTDFIQNPGCIIFDNMI